LEQYFFTIEAINFNQGVSCLMYLGTWIFFVVVGIGFIWGIKYKNLTILNVILIIIVYLLYFFIGYLLKMDVLNTFTFTENGLKVSFVGIILLLATFLIIRYFIHKLLGKNRK